MAPCQCGFHATPSSEGVAGVLTGRHRHWPRKAERVVDRFVIDTFRALVHLDGATSSQPVGDGVGLAGTTPSSPFVAVSEMTPPVTSLTDHFSDTSLVTVTW